MAILNKAKLMLKKMDAETTNPEISAIDNQLTSLDQKEQEVIFQIGMRYLEQNTLDSVAGTEYEPMFQEIEQIHTEQNSLNRKKLAVQGLRKCDSCENIISLDSVFCNKCGEKLPQLLEVVDTTSKNLCQKCGAELTDNASFCISCGAKVE